MKKPERTFTVEVGESALIGISPKAMLGIALTGDGKVYSAPIERIHKAMAGWHAKNTRAVRNGAAFQRPDMLRG